MLDFRLETFLCVCKHMNYTKAANELNLTQPAVSQHIKFLEEYYGTKLFFYNKKKLSLTLQGEYLRNVFEVFYHDSLYVKEKVSNIHKNPTLKIGATLSIGEYYVPKRIASFMKRNPDINLSVTVADTTVLVEQLDSGKIDFAMVEGYFDKPDYTYRLIKTEKMVAVCAADYEIKKVSGIDELFSERLIIREKGSGTREIFERYLHENGFNIKCFEHCCDFTSPHLILKMLLSGLGISFMYRTVAEKYLNNGMLREIEIENFNLMHEFNVIWKKNSLLNEYYKKVSEELIGAENFS